MELKDLFYQMLRKLKDVMLVAKRILFVSVLAGEIYHLLTGAAIASQDITMLVYYVVLHLLIILLENLNKH